MPPPSVPGVRSISVVTSDIFKVDKDYWRVFKALFSVCRPLPSQVQESEDRMSLDQLREELPVVQSRKETEEERRVRKEKERRHHKR
jgi:hypothetical protein